MTEATSGMVGRGFYDQHSEFQRSVADQATAAVAELAARSRAAGGRRRAVWRGRLWLRRRPQLDCDRWAHPRCGRRQCPEGCALDPFVVHNDLPSNDFATLLANLSAPGSYCGVRPEVRVLTAPRSFFEQVVPRGKIAFGVSDSAAHWLSRQPPGLDLPHGLYRSDAPPAKLAKVLDQAATNWSDFLGRGPMSWSPAVCLLVQMLGADLSGPRPRVSAAELMRLMGVCLER